eukprot:347501-Chlamydomonas_euryale.AAC.2
MMRSASSRRPSCVRPHTYTSTPRHAPPRSVCPQGPLPAGGRRVCDAARRHLHRRVGGVLRDAHNAGSAARLLDEHGHAGVEECGGQGEWAWRAGRMGRRREGMRMTHCGSGERRRVGGA